MRRGRWWVCWLGVLAAWVLAAAPARAAAPQIWFAPQAPYPPAQIEGAPDFWQLFAPHAPWQTVARHVQVLKLPTQFLAWVPAAKLAEIVVFLKRHHMALAVESLAQSWIGTRPCGQGVEGYGDPDQAAQIAAKIRRVGGVLSYVAMDEPLFFGHFYSGKNACGSTVNGVAARVAGVLAEYRAAFPHVVLGDIEPAGAALLPGWGPTYAAWLAAVRARLGAPLSFLDADVDWNAAGHMRGMLDLRGLALAQGLTFGVIYNGRDTARTDAAWLSDLAANGRATETALGGPPAQVVFQSWVSAPTRLLPESADLSFAYGILKYLERHGGAGR
jgi:hypothetical protein